MHFDKSLNLTHVFKEGLVLRPPRLDMAPNVLQNTSKALQNLSRKDTKKPPLPVRMAWAWKDRN